MTLIVSKNENRIYPKSLHPTSIISDKIGEFVAASAKAEENKLELFISGVLHIVFGLILFGVSLGASILFFITDRIIRKRNIKVQVEAGY
jgi:hypothetical protein